MAKRFTDTEKWENPEFLDLSCEAKILVCFLKDKCDSAGFYQRHDRKMTFCTQINPEKVESCYQEVSSILVIKDGWVWVKDFIEEQKNLPLNQKNPAHLAILRLLQKQADRFGEHYKLVLGFGVEELLDLLGASKGLFSPIGIGNGKGIGKGNKGVVKGEYTQAFEDFWKLYPSRSGRKLLKAQAFEYFAKLDEAMYPSLIQAVKNYASSGQLPKDPPRFFKDDYWKEWIGAQISKWDVSPTTSKKVSPDHFLQMLKDHERGVTNAPKS